MAAQEQKYSTALVKVTDTFAPMIERQLTGNGVNMDGYAKQCVINAISAINTVLEVKGITWNDPQLDRNNLTQILMNVAALKLNAAASPREVFFTLRNVKMGKDWVKQIEMGIEGDGNDAILSRFGRGVEQVGQFWLVREGDEFEYPVYTGFEVTPPVWKPKGQGEVVRVVYPIKKTDGTIEYHIAEREDVARNLLAHINNNLMNETFGILSAGKRRTDANADQLRQINAKKAEVLKRARDLGLDSLDDPELQQWISPAWTEHHSREQMLIRKMRNNIVKKIPKDFGNAFVEMTYHESSDDTKHIRKEVAENANREYIDIQAEVKPDEPNEAPDPSPENPNSADPEPTGEKEPEEAENTEESDPNQAELIFDQQMADPGF